MTESDPKTAEIDVLALWSKHEDIAMHFNDLLMRLRSQSLAGIAAVSTLVGLFSKEGIGSIKMDWLAASAIFIAMMCFWAAIWCLDFLYYNQLLVGAVEAIKDLEAKIELGPIKSIGLSTAIDARFDKKRPNCANSTGGVFFST